MGNRQISKNKHKLGFLLIKKGYICHKQLEMALKYHKENEVQLGTALIDLKFINSKQLNKTLKKQSLIKAITAAFAILYSPFNPIFASEQDQTLTQSQEQLITKNNLSNNKIYFKTEKLDPVLKEYYYSGKTDIGLSFNQNLSETTGMQLALLNQPSYEFENDTSYEFTPQISLFKSAYKAQKSSFNQSKTKRHDRYTNTIPAVIMLTLKGRSIYENTGYKSSSWSLKRANKGVQRKAELMLSITKQF